ncbi:MAG TPA: hypothetical protein VI137_06180 [Pseudolabrys sp.]
MSHPAIRTTNPGRPSGVIVDQHRIGGQNREVHNALPCWPQRIARCVAAREIALLFKEFTVLDDALSWARHLEGTGRIPLLIEGDDGTRMNRRAIIDALRVGMREQLGE